MNYVHPKQMMHLMRTDSLFRNSFFLMLSAAVTAGLGFIFWSLCARLYTPEQIGLGTALISAMSLISYISLLGVNSTFISFLPKSRQRNAKLNTGLILVLVAAVVLAAGYVISLPVIEPKLAFVYSNPWYAAGFILLVAMASLNLLTDSVFIAYRAAQYNLLIYILAGIVKLVLPLLALSLGAYGIFFASGAASLLALVFSLYYMVKKFDFKPKIEINRPIIQEVYSFARANYVANCLNILPTVVLPLVVVNRLGAAQAGYFYLAFMVANLLYTVAYSVAQSLFAEGSYSETALMSLVKRSVVILGAIMVPSALALMFLSRWLLLVFGKDYSVAAAQTLNTLALAAPVVALYTIAVVLMRVRKLLREIIIMNVVFAVAILGLGYVFADRGLVWVAYAWLAGHLLAGAYGFGVIGWQHLRANRS